VRLVPDLKLWTACHSVVVDFLSSFRLSLSQETSKWESDVCIHAPTQPVFAQTLG
jgi:hypothetical protein